MTNNYKNHIKKELNFDRITIRNDNTNERIECNIQSEDEKQR